MAIMGLLAALIVGSLAGGRESARRARCSANVRQLSLAVVIYSNEHRGDIPVVGDRSGLLLSRSACVEPFDAIRSQLNADAVGSWSDVPFVRCPSDNAIGPTVGVGYRYVPSAAFGVLEGQPPLSRARREREVLALYRSGVSGGYDTLWVEHNIVAHDSQEPRTVACHFGKVDGSVVFHTSEIRFDPFTLLPPVP